MVQGLVVDWLPDVAVKLVHHSWGHADSVIVTFVLHLV
nr:MAG TPA: hypothetical protein [Caudoviricetes sp.]